MKPQVPIIFRQAAFVVLVGWAAAGTANAATDEDSLQHRWSFLAGGGVWLHPEIGGHGIGLLAYDLTGLPRSAHLSAELNTDTLRLGVDRIRFFDGVLELGARLEGEGGFAGLLPDYYRDGLRDESRGFWASYLAGNLFVKLALPLNNFITAQVGGRRFFFSRAEKTDPAFILPKETWLLETRLRYTGWWIRHDPSISDRHRLFNRVRGIALGVELGLDRRSAAAPWGALDSTVFSPADPRNTPDKASFRVRQWLRAGVQALPILRTQLTQFAALGRGEDDLTRVRLGGMNPYVIPIAGAPWAALLSENLVAVEWSLNVGLASGLEIGTLLDGAYVQDVRRLGQDDYDWVLGTGLFMDWRLGNFQIDVRAGWAPGQQEAFSDHQLAAFAAVGWNR